MKIILPNGEKIGLDTNLPYEGRLEVANAILKEWDEYFRENWERQKTKICLDVISTYLCATNGEENRNKEDKYVMSSTKMKAMIRGDKRKTNFTDLSLEQKQLFGFAEHLEDGYN